MKPRSLAVWLWRESQSTPQQALEEDLMEVARLVALEASASNVVDKVSCTCRRLLRSILALAASQSLLRPLIHHVARPELNKTFNCGHAFHSTCVEEELECPKCRGLRMGAKIIACAGGAIAGVALAPVVAPAALGIIGFSAAGPVAGSIAALIQGSIGNVVAGSLFAGAQSVAMGGALPAIGYVTAAAAASSGAGAVVDTLGKLAGKKPSNAPKVSTTVPEGDLIEL
ncbi:hypothetical protein WOLCODRAFT_18433 [Wolfiporia cocos MD-104 SS10]|uniref:RING-type domain-containing protein n=1 Tax=Wolfiporia cocos (strain MD-104) TaxID=742152 RepID=A0A2H3K0D8_WOLCO|nr:hypothetical protein WOLCODRAFT_18433 [Wolfiporia cocos MD-104 SS10]